MLGAEHQAEIRQHDQHEAVEKLDARDRRCRPRTARRRCARAIAEPDRAADERAEDTRDRGFAQAALEQHDQARQDERERDVDGRSERKRMKQRGGVGDDADEQDAGKRKPGHLPTPVYEAAASI